MAAQPVKEQEFIAACKRASISAALDTQRAARRASIVAFLALLVSVIAAHEPILALIERVLAEFNH